MVLTVKPSPCCTMTSRRMSTSLCTCRRPSSDVNSGSSNANAKTFRNSRVSKWSNALMRTNQNDKLRVSQLNKIFQQTGGETDTEGVWE
jgi:hypothetical protein